MHNNDLLQSEEREMEILFSTLDPNRLLIVSFAKQSLTLCDPGIKCMQPFSNVASSKAIQTLIACSEVNDQ
jgi:hypothetical protein